MQHVLKYQKRGVTSSVIGTLFPPVCVCVCFLFLFFVFCSDGVVPCPPLGVFSSFLLLPRVLGGMGVLFLWGLVFGEALCVLYHYLEVGKIEALCIHTAVRYVSVRSVSDGQSKEWDEVAATRPPAGCPLVAPRTYL